MARRPIQNHTGLYTNNRVLGNPIVHVAPLNWGQTPLSNKNKIPKSLYQPGQALPSALAGSTQAKGGTCKHGG